MEKYTPHYDLALVKAEVIKLGFRAFTATAREGARQLELSLDQMQQVVCALERRMLCKSMTTYADHRVWQDVYLIKIYGTEIYIKVTYRPGGGPPVISFKEKPL
ncbi:type II toxin-antitoxin system MqsR family toxin [Pseudomonas sp. B6002]|uniref:type II toxin-antitoxin system MqsR family toxin n=1 Tax=Pseudomonas sp. B6002 TaxID=2726978 RepID=UPI00159FD97B|nr:type II toxin-antitoxin system MqsR family toxin [Pseudomonas sp. B6002]NVZ49609.1 type II toxin-antitoxin system MqsR family toxin [Pseudomonas sp. B6002]